jgi:hypothetical protein
LRLTPSAMSCWVMSPGRDQLVDVVAPAIEFLLTEGFANPGDEQVGSELNIIVTAWQRAAKIYR